jgi:hypothetical protein
MAQNINGKFIFEKGDTVRSLSNFTNGKVIEVESIDADTHDQVLLVQFGNSEPKKVSSKELDLMKRISPRYH